MICRDFEQDLALAAAGCLEPARLVQVQQHCASCSRCATRLRELQLVASDHADARLELEQVPAKSGKALPLAGLVDRDADDVYLLWRWLALGGVAVTLAVAILLLRSTPPPPRQPTVATAPPVTAGVGSEDSLPTFGVYRNALENSGEASLDALLARHQEHLLPKTPNGNLLRLREQL